MFGLSKNLKFRHAFYMSKLHGRTLADTVKAYSDPAYSSHGPCPSFESDFKTVKGWYGFPELGAIGRRIKPESFGTVYGLRCIGAGDTCGEYSNRDAQGYYCDSFQSETIYPLVFRLNSNRGFIAGHYLSDSGEVYMHKDVYGDMRDAFRAAHRRAESYAESCREDDAKFQAEQQIESLKDENKESLASVKKLVAELKGMCPSLADKPTIRETLKGELLSIRRDMRKNRKRIAALSDNYWLAVENY